MTHHFTANAKFLSYSATACIHHNGDGCWPTCFCTLLMEGNTLDGWQQSSKPANRPGQWESWLVEPNGDLSMLTQRLRLIIRRFDGCARFLVLKRPARGERDAEVLLSSGTATNVSKAKDAAQHAGTRLETTLGIVNR